MANAQQFIIQLEKAGDNLEKIMDGIDKPTKLAFKVSTFLFLGDVQEASPFWTGLLRSAHDIGPETFERPSEMESKGTAVVWVDPAVKTQHKYLGGIPSVYGATSNLIRDKEWFSDAIDVFEPEFFEHTERIFEKYFKSIVL